jgi:hypothetical protein
LQENDFAKAEKILEKAILLRKNFEQAFILQYHILIGAGK